MSPKLTPFLKEDKVFFKVFQIQNGKKERKKKKAEVKITSKRQEVPHVLPLLLRFLKIELWLLELNASLIQIFFFSSIN